MAVVLVCADEEQHARVPDAVPTSGARGPHRVEVIVVCCGGRGHRTVPQDTRQVRVADPRRARAAGLSVVRAEFAVVSDPGCRLLDGALPAGVDALLAHPDRDVALGRSRTGIGAQHAYEEDDSTRVVRTDHYVELLRADYIRMPAAVMFRTSAARAVSGSSDYDFLLELFRAAAVHYHGAVVAERVSPGGRPAWWTVADLAALRRQYPHVRDDPHALAAYREGAARLLGRHAVRVGNRLRGRDARGLDRHVHGLLAALGLVGAALRAPAGTSSTVVRREVLPWLARRPGGAGRIARLLADDQGGPGRQPVSSIAESVRATVPVGARIVVLGDPDPALDLPDRHVEYSSVDAAAGPGGLHAVDFVVLPAPARWSVVNRHRPSWERLRSLSTLRWEGRDCLIVEVDAPGARPAVRVLVAGYFSFVGGHATAGDLLTRDVVCGWLDELGHPYEIANAPPFTGGVDWRTVPTDRYTHVVFVCGPFAPWLGSHELLDRFAAARLVGINLSMLERLECWNPFDVLVERDSTRTTRADLAFAAEPGAVPVVGVCLREHADGTRTADAAIRRVLAGEHAALVPIDTRLDDLRDGRNSTGQRSPAEIEALIARVDVVVTTRLHGLVLALKNAVPVVAVDPASEGSKICKQARSVGWPAAFDIRDLTDDTLRAALRYCLTEEARRRARDCAATGRAAAAAMRSPFLAAFAGPTRA